MDDQFMAQQQHDDGSLWDGEIVSWLDELVLCLFVLLLVVIRTLFLFR